MPPKKKAGKGKGKKKKGKKKDTSDELNAEDLYKRASQEVDCLKERLAERQAYARKARASEEVMKERMVEAKVVMQEERLNKREITYDLTRQYKTMQSQLEGKVEFLEAQVRRLKKTLEITAEELQKVTKDRDRIKDEREQEVGSLHGKLQVMEKSFEAILQDSFDSLAVKMEGARQKWDSESRVVEKGVMQVLSKFGKDLKAIPEKP